jgi:hypothetical protein
LLCTHALQATRSYLAKHCLRLRGVPIGYLATHPLNANLTNGEDSDESNNCKCYVLIRSKIVERNKYHAVRPPGSRRKIVRRRRGDVKRRLQDHGGGEARAVAPLYRREPLRRGDHKDHSLKDAPGRLLGRGAGPGLSDGGHRDGVLGRHRISNGPAAVQPDRGPLLRLFALLRKRLVPQHSYPRGPP